MTNYVFTYRGGGMPETEAEQQAEMAAWGAWYGELGEALVDGGNPFGVSKTVSANGTTDSGESALSGYTIVQADDIEAAAKLAEGCPNNKRGGTVEVYETFNVM